MKRIAGIFLLFASAVSLALTAYMWRRSYRVSDAVTWVGGVDTREAASYAGAVHFKGVQQALPSFPMARRRRTSEPVPEAATWRTRRPFSVQVEWTMAGFVYASGAEVSGFLPMTSYQVGTPSTAGLTLQGGASTIPLDTLTGGAETVLPSPQVLQATGSGALTFTSGSTLVVWPMANHQVVVVPYWAVAAVVGIPAWWVVLALPWRARAWRRMRREGAGHA